ncbi:carboxypeptidase-like regulatory domain-containing protein, partial [bacterium]|nr:carboxypeptidase-like regulatory domain-containing protein [bacterium]
MNPKIFYRILLITISAYAHAASVDKVFIEGSILSSDDKPVKKADVQLLDAKKKKILSIKTDKNGYFKTDEFDAQNCYLQIDKKKESATVIIRSWPSENKNLTGLKIKLSKKGEKIKKSFGPNPEIKDGGANMAEVGPPSQLTKKQVKKKKIPKKQEKVFVSGKVLNKKGKPVKKATVIVIDQNYNSVAE